MLARGKVLMNAGHEEKATAEFNQMLADIVHRGVKYSVVKSATDNWHKINGKQKRYESICAITPLL